MAGAVPFGCGQCLPCRINKRRQWTYRQVFESLTHDENCFVTLTYDDDHLPSGGNLSPEDLRNFLKRLRKRLLDQRVRYFAVGEYGDVSLRPHYHLSLFGVSGRTDVISKKTVRHYGVSKLISDSWGRGQTLCAEFNEQTAHYTAGYTTKKMTAKGDPRLGGRTPEFSRMSRMPGLGREAMTIVASTLLNSAVSWESGDVPSSLKMGRKNIPLGRYLLRWLRHAVGFSPDYVKELTAGTTYDKSLEVLALFQNTFTDEALATPRAAFLKSIEGKLAQVEARSKIHAMKGTNREAL